MRPTALFFLFLLACLALGALLTYPVLATGLVQAEPHRVMGRLAQLFMLLGIWPFLKALGLADRQALGFAVPRAVFLCALWRGWLAGLAILAALALALLALGVRVPDRLGEGWLVELGLRALQALAGGLLIGLLEETFFRGALYTAIRRGAGIWPAVLWTSVLYAAVHFLKPRPLGAGAAFDWAGTWAMLAGAFTGLWRWEHVDSLAALLLVGVFLALVRERSGHIGWCIGLHAGWVFVIQLTRQLTDKDPSSPQAWLTGGYDGVIGWLAAIWIGLLALGFAAWARRGERAAPLSRA